MPDKESKIRNFSQSTKIKDIYGLERENKYTEKK